MQSGANTDATRSTDHVWLNTLIVTSSCAQQLGLNSWVLASCLSSEFGGCRTGLEPGCRGCSRAGLASQARGAVPVSPPQVRTLFLPQACIACCNELLHVVDCGVHNSPGNVREDHLVRGGNQWSVHKSDC